MSSDEEAAGTVIVLLLVLDYAWELPTPGCHLYGLSSLCGYKQKVVVKQVIHAAYSSGSVRFNDTPFTSLGLGNRLCDASHSRLAVVVPTCLGHLGIGSWGYPPSPPLCHISSNTHLFFPYVGYLLLSNYNT